MKRIIIICIAAIGCASPLETQEPPPDPGFDPFAGLVVAAEASCSDYDRDDYRYSPAVETELIGREYGIVYGPYTDRVFGSGIDTDIEHIVATREAHDSGACAWSLEKRSVFGSDPVNLTLAAPSVNRSKGSRDPGEWLPERNACWYLARHATVKRLYGLSVDPAEIEAMRAAWMARGCEG